MAMESHSFTCPATRRQRPFVGGIARLSLPALLQGYMPIYVLHRELNPDKVTHPGTNWARRRLTSLIDTNVLPLRQTTIANSP